MKHILLFASCFLSLMMLAQAPYSFETFTDNYTPLSNSTSLNQGQIWDDPEYTVPIGFQWTFYDVSTFQINFEGLGASLIVPNGETTANVIIPYISDIIDAGYANENSLSNISYQTTGEPGSQIFKLEWDNCGFYNEVDAFGTSTNRISFQMWIYEDSNDIEFRFGPNTIKDNNIVHDGIIGGGLFLNAAFNSNTWDAGYFLSGDHTNPSFELVPEDIYALNGLSDNPENGRVYRFFNMLVDVEESTSSQVELDFRLFQKSNDELSLVTPEGNTTVEVRGITGQLIEQFNCSGNMTKNISDYAPGIYLVHFEMNGAHKTLRFVKN